MNIFAGLFSSVQSTVTTILVTLVLVMGVTGYFYYQINEHNIQVLNQNNAVLKNSVAVQGQTIAALQAQQQAQAQMITDLQNLMQQVQQAEQEALIKIQKLNVTGLAHTDNKAATAVVNNASNAILTDFHNITVVGGPKAPTPAPVTPPTSEPQPNATQ
jgi:Tfp pilus assembly protein PilO